MVREVLLPPLEGLANVIVTDPLPYGDFARLMHASTLILTDSGGVQEEAPSLGKPVLVLRDTTERPEAVEAGTVRLVGTDEHLIVDEVSRLLTDPARYDADGQGGEPLRRRPGGGAGPRGARALLRAGPAAPRLGG